MSRRARLAIAAVIGTALLGGGIATWCFQAPTVRALDPKVLREYAGVYQYGPGAYLYLQMWNELSGANQLVAFDESGDIRTLFPTDVDRFFTGPGAAVSSSVESLVTAQRRPNGAIASLTWRRDGAQTRVAERVDIEQQHDVRFANDDTQLAGTLIMPATGARHPAVVLVHYSGPANRESVLPFARFLVRRGVAVLGYDKRGVGGSTGDWQHASYDDLAGDAVAAVEYLKTRSDIDGARIGMLGVSQAGWILPLAAARTQDLAFLISVSGASVTAAETGLDHARNEMIASNTPAPLVEQIVGLMSAQYAYAQTGRGWNDYVARRNALASRMGGSPPNFPDTPDDPHWQTMRRLYFVDPAPAIRQLRVPTLVILGELDNNIVAEKNAAAWKAALDAGNHPDYTIRVLRGANHLQLEARRGNNAEMPSLQRFVPEYTTTIEGWLLPRLRGRGVSTTPAVAPSR